MAYLVKDLKEAQLLLTQCQEQTEEILTQLKSVKNWSWADLIGDSFFFSWIKRDKMRQTNEKMRHLRSLLKNLKKELLDLDIQFEI